MSEEQVATQTSYVLVGEKPLLVIDLLDDRTDPLTAEDDPVVWSFIDRGFALLPAFFDVALPGENDFTVTLTVDGRFVFSYEGQPLTESSLGDLPDAWVDAVANQRGAIVVIGRGIGAGEPDMAEPAIKRVDDAAKAGRVAGATVLLE